MPPGRSLGNRTCCAVSPSRAQCETTSETLWLNVHGRDFCIRYYLSTAGGEGSRPVVFLSGDQLGKLNPKTWTWADSSDAKDIDTDDIVQIADTFSKMAKTTAIYLARIGVDGTSGNHTSRKTVLELDLVNAALDGIKRHHGFEGFGRSGGATSMMIETRLHEGASAEHRAGNIVAQPQETGGDLRTTRLARQMTYSAQSRRAVSPICRAMSIVGARQRWVARRWLWSRADAPAISAIGSR